VFSESSIYRIDHYLGKEAVENLLHFRFANTMYHESVRDEHVKVLRSIRPLDPDHLIRGQFEGYQDEPGVTRASTVETFAALPLEVDSWRWWGVPWLLRAGKHLPVTATEVLLRFNRPPLAHI
jgi:glucose-6-phosphate 1-dehydrogenase